jgi:lipopolysaccharide transport system ATP-binding protein
MIPSHLPSTAAEGGFPASSTSDQEVLVRVEGVSKKFCRSLKKSLWYGVRDICSELNPFGSTVEGDGRWKMSDGSPSPISHLPSPTSRTDQNPSALRTDEFWSVRDVSFELRRGECLGLIGCNGAGKTTLLKMLNGLIKPDKGRIEMRGRVGALIALGAGFNPILSGRENIYVNGSVLGLTKQEIDEKIEEIIDFADIREFIDTPVQNYSSGMQVRLGFAVATALKPDVLLLDEVLAVGDAAFRAKCYKRISSLASHAAIIFVSHSMEQIGQVCSRALVMCGGSAIFVGDVVQGIQRYNTINEFGGTETEKHEHSSDEVILRRLECPQIVCYGGVLQIQIECELSRTIEQADVKLTLFDVRENITAEAYTKSELSMLKLQQGPISLDITAGPLFLRQGTYALSIVLLNRLNNDHLYWGSRIRLFKAEGPTFGAGATLPPIRVIVRPQ